jgi:MarR family transcriptional regulator, organic hydroperoxide resistance regulator
MSESLKLSNQICFPIYSLSKEIIQQYRPFLDELDLTYPQYLVMLVLWENDFLTVGQIGEKLNLDTGTLTPLLKRLELKKCINRTRSEEDERIVRISLTDFGKKLKEKAVCIPSKMREQYDLSEEELIVFNTIIQKILTKQNK